ncbi:MarR family winged helix-turn-helix transcriptional regulator [Dietzia timorensis]|uniref:HTH marR-type domain-containing protein n=1 Tax=Dietzia timorensis TaxID=499555 RepID=A0A173LKX2_9ACTN|nr:MarR family transcriptional regulator [Dietzia timorensis]ANI92369.1 Hypothetical protein BJL86_1592 [Dietzia timorensis]
MNRAQTFDLLTVIGLRLAAAVDLGSAALGLTAAESRAVVCLQEHGPSRPSVVAERLEISRRRMTQVAKTLEGKGLAELMPEPGDGRAKHLALTTDGATLADEVTTMRDLWAQEILKDIPEKEVAHLGESLSRILQTLPPAVHQVS